MRGFFRKRILFTHLFQTATDTLCATFRTCLNHPEDEPVLDRFKLDRNPSNPDPEDIDQSPTWKALEVQLDDGRTLVLEYF